MRTHKISRIVFCLAHAGLLLAGLFLLLTGISKAVYADRGDLFVMPNGTGDCSQGNPCSLQTAISTATDGYTIYLSGGTYTGSGNAVATINQNITVYGGWDGSAATPPVCNPAVYLTSIDGEGARRGVVVESGATVTLEGFTITNGMDTFQGAGLYSQAANLTMRYMTFLNNAIDVHDIPDTYAYGGGAMVEGGTLAVEASTFTGNSTCSKISDYGGGLSIYGPVTATVTNSLFLNNDAWHASGLYFKGDSISNSTFILENSTFTGNGQGRSPGIASGGYAGAIRVTHAKARIENNIVSDSRASNDYGAVAIYSSDLILKRNTITGNQSGRTSGLYMSGSTPFIVTNNIIADNQSTYTWMDDTPCVRVRGSEGTFLHNTIARNTCNHGIWVDSGGAVDLTNNILVGHTTGISVSENSSATLEATLWGTGVWANETDWTGEGTISTGTVNIWDDPEFLDSDGGNYRIGPASAAVDAGVDAGVTIDIDGNPRPAGLGFDIGADEFSYNVTSELWAKAILQVAGSPVTLVWQEVGRDITPSGAQVVSGYFYADPNDFVYGSRYNPEVFVKIYIATNGWCNIAFNHVTVDDVTVYSAHNYSGTPDKTGTVSLTSRLAEHQYDGVNIDTSLSSNGLGSYSDDGRFSLISATATGGGYVINSDLWEKAVLQAPGGPVTLKWKEVGADNTPTGARVVSGYFYADPAEFAYGSEYNPELFVKIYIDPNGWANIASNHVTVDNVSVSSSHNYDGTPDQSGIATLLNRLVEQQYTGVTIE